MHLYTNYSSPPYNGSLFFFVCFTLHDFRIWLEMCWIMVGLARLFTFPYFFEDHEDRALTSTGSQLGFMCTVPHSLSRFDTHSRWPPITQSAESQRYYGKIGYCEQSNLWPTPKHPARHKNKSLEPKVFLDQFRSLGNCPPTPSLI